MINMNSRIKFNGKTYTMAEFGERMKMDIMDVDNFMDMVQRLANAGRISIVDNSTPEDKLVQEVLEQKALEDHVEVISSEEQAYEQAQRDKKKAESDLFSFSLVFIRTVNATQFAKWLLENNIPLEEGCITNDPNTGSVLLHIKDVTRAEMNAISNKYNIECAIDKTVAGTQKVVDKTTDGINYVSKELVAPVGKIAGAGVINLGKGLFHTAVKLGASLINDTAKAVAETKQDMATDPELLRAQIQVIHAKNSVNRKINDVMGRNASGSGIIMD